MMTIQGGVSRAMGLISIVMSVLLYEVEATDASASDALGVMRHVAVDMVLELSVFFFLLGLVLLRFDKVFFRGKAFPKNAGKLIRAEFQAGNVKAALGHWRAAAKSSFPCPMDTLRT